jgi:hypothetical protein
MDFGFRLEFSAKTRHSYERYETLHRHCGDTTRHEERGIPFEFRIKLPALRYERMITSRDGQGRIVKASPY